MTSCWFCGFIWYLIIHDDALINTHYEKTASSWLNKEQSTLLYAQGWSTKGGLTWCLISYSEVFCVHQKMSLSWNPAKYHTRRSLLIHTRIGSMPPSSQLACNRYLIAVFHATQPSHQLLSSYSNNQCHRTTFMINTIYKQNKNIILS